MDYIFLKKIFTLLTCVLFSILTYSQEFQGVITDVNSNPINNCFIIFINPDNNETIDYVILDDTGKYKISLKQLDTKSVIIKCQGATYVSQMKVFELNSNNRIYNVNFSLETKVNLLNEIIVISERVAVRTKNDTTVYDVSKFKRIEDRKIINVLKNMPGILVDEKTGLIKYKGKPIETLLLDGDNLFGKGYSTAARTISSDLVETVEAIEDYHGNKLKKGLKKSDDVVLNLKFKKDKFKISGETSLGLGKDRHLANANIINLSNKIKGFGAININNISLNETSFQRDTYASENQEEIENSSIDFFNESNLTRSTIFPRSYINNIKFGTVSNLFKVSDKIKLKNTISYFNDLNNYSSFSKNELIIDDNIIKTSNETFNTAQPLFITMSNDINIDVSRTSIFTFSNRVINYKNVYNQTNLQNEESIYQTQINHSKLYYQQNINFTKKVSNNDLIEVNLVNSNDNRKQKIAIANQQNIIFNDDVFKNMGFKNEREIYLAKLSYLKKVNKWNFEIVAKQAFDRENFTRT